MLLLPLLSQPESSNRTAIPFGLILLTVLMAIFFLFFQLEDFKYKKEAVQYYFKSELDQYEVPLYIKYIKKNMRDDVYYNLLESMNNGTITKTELYWIIRNDRDFQNCLNDESCVVANSLSFLKWQEHRREYLLILSKDGFYQYGFKPGEPTVAALLISPFIQNSPFELVVNLLFLLAVGALTERKVGLTNVLFYYMLGCYFMVSLYSLMVPHTIIPISGASGGVACLLGIAIGSHKLESTRWYYFALRGFKYFVAKPIVLLLAWMVLQTISVILTDNDLLSLFVQSCSLALGFVMGLLYAPKAPKAQQLQEEQESDYTSRLNTAIGYISKADYPQAKAILYRLLDEYPNSRDVMFQIYNMEKSYPGSEEYHNIVQKIFAIKDSSSTTVAMINLVFKNYLRRAQPTIRFNVSAFTELLQRFRKAGYNDDAQKILKVLSRYNHDGSLSETLAREQLLLARNYIDNNDIVQSDRLIHSLLESFPKTESAKRAKTMIAHKNV